MIRYIQLVFVPFLLSCTSGEQNELDNWELYNAETIEHLEIVDQKIQVVYSTQSTGFVSFVDTSLVAQTFEDTLLLEEIHYTLEEGDTIKWSHHINRYNSARQLIEEIDSVNGSIRNHKLNFYEGNKLVRTEFLSVIPDYNEMMELVGTDTSKSVIKRFYDEHGRCFKVIALSKDELTSDLTGTIKYDTVLTFNQFDDRNLEIGSVTIMDKDTVSMSRVEYDKQGRETKFIYVSLENGATTFRYKYDERGNLTSEKMLSDNFSEHIITEFDEENRPVNRKTYRPKTLANIRR